MLFRASATNEAMKRCEGRIRAGADERVMARYRIALSLRAARLAIEEGAEEVAMHHVAAADEGITEEGEST